MVSKGDKSYEGALIHSSRERCTEATLLMDKRQKLRRILARWETWVITILVLSGALGIVMYVWRVSNLLRQNYLTSYEANTLILQAVLTPVVAAPALAAALIGVASLRAQQRVQKEARRPILDAGITSPLRAGSSQYEKIVIVKVTNIGPGPAMDAKVELKAIGVTPKSASIGVLGPGASAEAEISITIQTIGQKAEIVATCVDLFGSNWISIRTYAAFPANIGPARIFLDSNLPSGVGLDVPNCK